MKDRLIIALDVQDKNKAQKLINLLYPKVKIFKIGSILFTACGPSIVSYIHKEGANVFLDLKYHDIPSTVANAVRQAVRLKVAMLTLHIQGGKDMLKAAVSAADEEAKLLKLKRPLLIGVTVLTSQATTQEKVLQLAKEALDCGLDGAVCSVQEALMLRKECGKNFIIITPGIRLKEQGRDDQKRIATAQEAFRAGADYIVVGRPITAAKDPLKAVKEILQQQ